jgi:hypothetical protein
MAANGCRDVEAILEKVMENLRRAMDETTWLRALLQAAETQLQEQALGLEGTRREE